MAGISHTYLPIKAAISFFMDAWDQAPLILPKMQDQQSLMLRWRACSGCRRVRESVHLPHCGGQYVENKMSHTCVHIFRLSVAYANVTINVKPEMQNQRFELTGVFKPGETCRFKGIDPGLARQESAGGIFGLVWNLTNPFLRSKPRLLAGYLDPLAILYKTSRAGWVDLLRSVWDFESSWWNLSTPLQVAIYGVHYLWGSGSESFITTIHVIYHVHLCDNHKTKSDITILYV